MPAAPNSARVAILDDYQNVVHTLADWSGQQPGLEAVFFNDHVADIDQLAARLQPFDAVVLTRERTHVDAALMQRLPNLKLIATVGMWNIAIDVPGARARGIHVCGTTGGEPQATAGLTWGLVLAVTRNIYQEAASLRAGAWQRSLGVDIHGKTLGVLGLGRIGSLVAGYGKAFGMRTIAWSQNMTAEQARAAGAEYVEKDELFRQSDVLAIHLKLSERTEGIVARRELALMKPTAYLVNTSRGPLVREADLIAALRDHRIAGVGLDTFDVEPLPAAHPYRYLPNVLATPHIGYVADRTYHDAFPQILENILAWRAGTPIRLLP